MGDVGSVTRRALTVKCDANQCVSEAEGRRVCCSAARGVVRERCENSTQTGTRERRRLTLTRCASSSRACSATRRSKRPRMLRRIVESTLAGDTRELTEYALGFELFGRKDFDPKIHNIVRAHAHRLRRRMEDYFSGLGRDDPIVIEVPKGH